MELGSRQPDLSLGQKLLQINWAFILLISVVASIGFAMLYSAANGSFDPWASRQMTRFGAGVVMMIGIALVDIRVWMRHAYSIYGLAVALLIGVEIAGSVGGGAQRWLDLGVVTLQPSELTKIALILALARYFHGVSAEDSNRILPAFPAAFLIAVPAFLVLRQPDLGTAILLIAAGASMLFLAGLRLRWFVLSGLAGVGAIPVIWRFLKGYQKQRLLTFLDPEIDPLGAGYHILQSKIALGSGGLFGKGFLQGTQSHLNFLPEKQTDFIFTMLAEEFGMAGGLTLIGLYILILIYGFAISLRSRSQFGRLLGMGVTVTFMLNVLVNIAMVMGLVPVVGMPLPLISYGGTALLTLLLGFGLLLGVYVHRDITIGRHAGSEP